MEAEESIVVVQKLLGHKKLNHTLLYLESQTKTNRDIEFGEQLHEEVMEKVSNRQWLTG